MNKLSSVSILLDILHHDLSSMQMQCRGLSCSGSSSGVCFLLTLEKAVPQVFPEYTDGHHPFSSQLPLERLRCKKDAAGLHNIQILEEYFYLTSHAWYLCATCKRTVLLRVEECV